MKKFFCISALLWMNLLGFAQVNLVPNGNFETGPDSTSAAWFSGIDSACSTTNNVPGPDYWSVVNPSPDRLIEGDIPCNWDDDTAAFGKAYVVFGAYNESGQAALQSQILKDSTYQLSCYFSRNTFSYTLIVDGKIFETKKMVKQQ